MKDSDFSAIRKIISVCFNIPLCESDEEATALIATDKSMLGRNYYNRLVAENEDGVITSTLRIAPYKASFDGGEIKIADIGAVASLPEYRKETGHGGKDFLCYREFFCHVLEGKPMPIDAYDGAVVMAVSPLSELSLKCGGMPVAFPDFKGKKN